MTPRAEVPSRVLFQFYDFIEQLNCSKKPYSCFDLKNTDLFSELEIRNEN